MTFIWMYFLDVITSPVAWAAFGLGCIITAGSVLAGLWFGRNGARYRYLAATRPLSTPPDDEWESTQIVGCWMNVTHRVSISPFYVHVVNEDTQNTETCYLPHDQARSLATWILDHLRGVSK